MSNDKISASIESLRAEIQNLKVEDTKTKTRLDGLVADLEKQLEEPENAGAAGLDESVKELIEHFEVEHPRITGILNDLMVTLSGMGI
ncbi:MAG TPA: DUF4404 family protein [Gammaproteobacteria bacterium]|jgi:chromosome segregation ATPase|nr:DUF4404 family protein [Gammaproteobacteria bacterium]